MLSFPTAALALENVADVWRQIVSSRWLRAALRHPPHHTSAPKTVSDAAVRAEQRSRNRVVDGEVPPQTWPALPTRKWRRTAASEACISG